MLFNIAVSGDTNVHLGAVLAPPPGLPGCQDHPPDTRPDPMSVYIAGETYTPPGHSSGSDVRIFAGENIYPPLAIVPGRFCWGGTLSGSGLFHMLRSRFRHCSSFSSPDSGIAGEPPSLTVGTIEKGKRQAVTYISS